MAVGQFAQDFQVHRSGTEQGRERLGGLVEAVHAAQERRLAEDEAARGGAVRDGRQAVERREFAAALRLRPNAQRRQKQYGNVSESLHMHTFFTKICIIP